MTEAKRCLKSSKVGFIGGGNMASAIGAALIQKDILNPSNVWVSTRTDRTHGFWRDLGAHPTLRNIEVFNNCDIIFLAVKPQFLDDALSSIAEDRTEKHRSKLFVSILAGVTLDTLCNKLSGIVALPKIIRSMPNTPMMVGEGITVYCSNNAGPGDLDLVDTMFSCLGISQNVPESLMNAVSGLSGSGPAFVYLIIEALADGAVKKGVPRPMATTFAAQVLVGAGTMVLETGRHPGQLKDEVCSPGGTTITGIHAMEVGGVRASMMNAVEAAVNRANEISAVYQHDK